MGFRRVGVARYERRSTSNNHERRDGDEERKVKQQSHSHHDTFRGMLTMESFSVMDSSMLMIDTCV